MISNKELCNIKILVVGAGGIGCELLKNLVITGFNNIEIIDLDTIELSNLNRQFLFQKNNVGHSKAEVAGKNVLRFNPEATIISHHDSVMNGKYNTEYFKSFNIVLNALDNKAARSHVNRLCLAADVPLIESGSAGYLGQVTVIKKGLTECYDCLPKPPTKTFPGCTIRNTPSEPVHCIVWAKNLFNQLFGNEDPDEAVSPDTEDPENANENSDAEKNGNSTNERVSTRKWAEETNYDPIKIFKKLFHEDIKYLLSMHKLWEKRKPPTPLDFDQIKTQDSNNGEVGIKDDSTSKKLKSQSVWSIEECLEYFCKSINSLKLKLENLGDEENKTLIWDKDDEESLLFVTAAANIRSFIFSIPLKSKFDVKSIAGNIIPAIATTNAIIAGFIVLQAIIIITTGVKNCKTVYLRDKPLQQKLIVDSSLVNPNTKCYVCSSKPELVVKMNVNKFTIKQLETQVLKNELNMIAPDVEIDDGSGRIIVSSEEGETEANDNRPLSHYGLHHGSYLKCDDFLQNYEIRLIIFQNNELDDGFEITGDKESVINSNEKQKEEPKESKSKKRSWSDGGSTETGSIDANKKRKMNNDDDDIELILEANDNNTNNADDDEFISIIE